MSDDKDPIELKISEGVKDLAKRIEKQLKIGEGGVVTLEKDFTEGLLPEGLTMADIKKTQDFRADLMSATGLALGKKGIEHFVKNKSADIITAGFGFGKDSADLSYLRSKTYPAIGGRDASTKYGVLSSKYVANGAVNSRGTFKKISVHLQALAQDAYGGK